MSNSGPPTSNGDENRQGHILIIGIFATVLSGLVVALRMVTRIWIVRNVGWDDYTIVAATIGNIIGLGLAIIQVQYGFGRHKFYLDDWEFIEFTKYSYGEWIQGFQTLMLTKLSICILLLRIPVEKHLIRPIQGAIAFLIITNLVLTLLWIFQCNPIAGSWNKMTPATCFTDAQLLRIIISQAIISIVSDFALALFPIELLRKVQIQRRTKIGLCILMSLGLITAACCTVRTVMNWQNISSDPTWTSVVNWYWRTWEVSIGIVAASIPPLRPAYKLVTSGMKTYLSKRSFRKSSSGALEESGHPSKPASAFARIFPRRSNESAMEAAAHTVSVEAGRAQAYGEGEEGFAMQNLPGDQGIQKTTRIDIENMSA
ncbi:MAG: hypothetical protein L6R38_008096 [Xanthoria sp. 2 TBL-2021]|nr:MAG: hypothetical protein L6R38_008096 [Xanthoria sp. 2 TBL-2021]